VFATHSCALCVVLYLAVKSLDHTPKYIDDMLATISTINSIKNMNIHNKTHIYVATKVRTKVILSQLTAVARGDGGGRYWLVQMKWRPAGWSVCLPLLIFPYTIKSRSSLLAPAHPGGPGKRAVKWLWCGGVNNNNHFIAVIRPLFVQLNNKETNRKQKISSMV